MKGHLEGGPKSPGSLGGTTTITPWSKKPRIPNLRPIGRFFFHPNPQVGWIRKFPIPLLETPRRSIVKSKLMESKTSNERPGTAFGEIAGLLLRKSWWLLVFLWGGIVPIRGETSIMLGEICCFPCIFAGGSQSL